MVSRSAFVLATVLLVAGLFILFAGSRGHLPTLTNDDERYGLGWIPLRLLLAAGGALALFAFTQWPVAGFYGGLCGFLAPSLWEARRRRRREIERVESIATWIETVRDSMAASAGLQEALRLSARVPPAPIAGEIREMVVRLQHQSVPQALRNFAGAMKHPLADQVVAALILTSVRSGGSLRPVLIMTSAAARDTAAMWRQVESGRSNVRQQARLASIISIGLMLFMVAQSREFLRPFDTIVGQIVLFVILGAFMVSGIVLYRMSQPVRAERVFDGIENWSYESAISMGGRRV